MADQQVVLRITGDSTGAVANLKKVEGSVKDFADNTGSLAAQVKMHWLGLGAALVSVAGAWTIASRVLESMDSLSKMSQKLGVAVESLQAYRHAASLADVTIDQLQRGLSWLVKTAFDAASGLQGANQGFASLGISVTDATGKLKGTDTLFEEVADRLSKMEDGSEKTAIAMDLFGRSGANLIPLLNEGRDGLREMREEVEKLGISISEDAAKNAEAFNDNMTRLQRLAGGFATQVMSELLPAMAGYSDSLVEAAKNSDGLKTAAEYTATAIKGIASGVLIVVSAFQVLASAGAATFAGLYKGAQGLSWILSKISPFKGMRERFAEASEQSGMLASSLWDTAKMHYEGAGASLAKMVALWNDQVTNAGKQGVGSVTAARASAEAIAKSLKGQLEEYKSYYSQLTKLQHDYKAMMEKSIKEIAALDREMMESRRQTADLLYEAWDKANPAKDPMEAWQRQAARLAEREDYARTLGGADRAKELQDIQRAWASMAATVEQSETVRKLVTGGEGSLFGLTADFADVTATKTVNMYDTIRTKITELGSEIVDTQAEMKAAAEQNLAKQTEGLNMVTEAMRLIESQAKDIDAILAKPLTLNIETSAALDSLATVRREVEALNVALGQSIAYNPGSIGSIGPSPADTPSSPSPSGSPSMTSVFGPGGGVFTPVYPEPKAAGTKYIPRTGYYLMHQGEEVKDARRTAESSRSMRISLGGISIVAGNGESAEDLARRIVKPLQAELKKLKYMQ